MKPEETARKLMAKGRLEAEHVEENMLERAEEELATGTAGSKDLDEHARELLSQKRQKDHASEEKMLLRSEEEIQHKE